MDNVCKKSCFTVGTRGNFILEGTNGQHDHQISNSNKGSQRKTFKTKKRNRFERRTTELSKCLQCTCKPVTNK